MYDYQISRKQQITLQMYEIYNEKITDLLKVPTGKTKPLNISFVPDTGSFVKVYIYIYTFAIYLYIYTFLPI